MSSITLDSTIVNALLTPVGTHVPSPAKPGLLDFARLVIELDAERNAPAPMPATLPTNVPAQVAPAPKPRKSTVKSEDVPAWRSLKVSDSQIARINRLETALDNAYGEVTARSSMADFANKGEASDYYNSLTPEATALGLNWAA